MGSKKEAVYLEFDPRDYQIEGANSVDYNNLSSLDIHKLISEAEKNDFKFTDFLQIGRVKNNAEIHYLSSFSRNVFNLQDVLDWMQNSSECACQDPSACELYDIIETKIKSILNA